MTTILVRGASSPRPGWSSLMRLAAGGIQRWRRARRDRLYLQALPDSMLEDIGVSRSEIDSLARQAPSGTWRRARHI